MTVATVAVDASRRAALLVAYIHSVRSSDFRNCGPESG
jgi:hypothetical protein